MDRDKITKETWDRAALLYQEKFMDLDRYNDSYDMFCDLVKKRDPRIFEIACGPGNITKYILSKRPDFNVQAIDLAPAMIVLAKQNNPRADFEVRDCRTIDELPGRFDAILSGFCLPYLSKEEAIKLIEDVSKLLNRPGVLYLSTMEDDYSKSGMESSSTGDQVFVHYHEAAYLTAALVENHFEIVNMERKHYVHNGRETTDLIIIART